MKNIFNCDDEITLEGIFAPHGCYTHEEDNDLYRITNDTIYVKPQIRRIEEGCFSDDTMEGIHRIVFLGPIVLESGAIDSREITSIRFEDRLVFMRPEAIQCPNLEELVLYNIIDEDIDLTDFPKLRRIRVCRSRPGDCVSSPSKASQERR